MLELRRPQLALATVLLLALLSACERGDGPVPIAFDRTPCAHCRMLVSDPRFAAQIQTAEGEVLDFDDPGCLLSWRAEHAPQPRAVWYHHVYEERWLREPEAAFVSVADSPMGFGIGAVSIGAPGSFDRTEALARVKSAASRVEQRP